MEKYIKIEDYEKHEEKKFYLKKVNDSWTCALFINNKFEHEVEITLFYDNFILINFNEKFYLYNILTGKLLFNSPSDASILLFDKYAFISNKNECIILNMESEIIEYRKNDSKFKKMNGKYACIRENTHTRSIIKIFNVVEGKFVLENVPGAYAYDNKLYIKNDFLFAENCYVSGGSYCYRIYNLKTGENYLSKSDPKYEDASLYTNGYVLTSKSEGEFEYFDVDNSEHNNTFAPINIRLGKEIDCISGDYALKNNIRVISVIRHQYTSDKFNSYIYNLKTGKTVFKGKGYCSVFTDFNNTYFTVHKGECITVCSIDKDKLTYKEVFKKDYSNELPEYKPISVSKIYGDYLFIDLIDGRMDCIDLRNGKTVCRGTIEEIKYLDDKIYLRRSQGISVLTSKKRDIIQTNFYSDRFNQLRNNSDNICDLFSEYNFFDSVNKENIKIINGSPCIELFCDDSTVYYSKITVEGLNILSTYNKVVSDLDRRRLEAKKYEALVKISTKITNINDSDLKEIKDEEKKLVLKIGNN